MTLKSLVAVTALAVTTLSTAALADGHNDSGWYAGVNGGVNFQFDQDSDGSPNRNLELDFDTGYAITGQVGYKFAEGKHGGFRTEAEIGYRENDVDGIVFNGNNQVGVGAQEQNVLSGLVNVYYDFNTPSKKFTPFVGAGIGIAELESEVAYNGGNAFVNDEDTAFAFQLIGGASYDLNEKWSLVGDARYFQIVNPELTRFGGPAPAQFTDLDSEYESFSVTAGLRYKF